MRVRIGAPIVAAAAIFAATASSGCELLQPKVSRDKLEAALSDWLVAHDLVASEIHCPDGEKLEKGHTFRCTCEVHGVEVPVDVEVTDPATGAVEWNPVHLTLKGEEFASEIRGMPRFAGHDLSVTCADKVVVSVPDSEWTCELVDHAADDKTYTAKVKFTDSKGTHDINFEEK